MKLVTHKVCRKCNEIKLIELFHKNKGMTDGRLHTCKACSYISNRKLAENNKEKINKSKRKWEAINKEFSDNCKRLYKINNREKHLAQSSAYAKANRSKNNSATARYRSRKLKATPELSELDALIIEEIYDMARLRQECSGIKMHVDHRVPLASDRVCGLHNTANLRIITAHQNHSKNNRYWEHM